MADRLTKEQIEDALASLAAEPIEVVVVPLPDSGAVADLRAWGRGEAAELAEAGAIRNDEQTMEAVAALLTVFAAERIPPDFSWRFVIVPAFDQPLLTVTLGFAEAVGDEDAALDALVGVGEPAPAGEHVADFDLDGRTGRHRLGFALRDPRTGEVTEDGELWVTAGVACRRNLPGAGLTDVLAVSTTPYAAQCAAVLPTIYELVTGEFLSDTVAEALARR